MTLSLEQRFPEDLSVLKQLFGADEVEGKLRPEIRRQDTYPPTNENHCNRYAVAVTLEVS